MPSIELLNQNGKKVGNLDLADEIFVINVDNYIGDSTRNEIAYAKSKGKRVNFLEGNQVIH